MLLGTPVIASDLPGVRVPVQTTGMGLLFPPGDDSRLTGSLSEVINHRQRYTTQLQLNSAREAFDPQKTFAIYDQIIHQTFSR
jgi:glycosyltransferase involved in cell wall biosynthesis